MEQLEADARLEVASMDLHSALMAGEEVLAIEFDVHLASHRQQKMFERNPILYLTKKMGSSEVQLQKLTPYQRAQFGRAKAKEVHQKQCCEEMSQ